MTTQTQIIEKAPPHDDELECIVLGVIMNVSDSIDSVIGILRPESFYKSENRMIYEAILKLKKKDAQIDIFTVVDQLQKDKTIEKVGGAYYVASLTEKVGTDNHLVYHAEILREKEIERNLITANTTLGFELKDPSIDLQTKIDNAYKMLGYALDSIVKGTASTVKTILPDVIKEITEASKSGNGISGVPTGFPSIDKVTQGWQNTDMIVVAARPSMGKTAFALSMIINIAAQGIQCCLFSCEMSKNQIVKRILSMTSGLNSSLLRGGNLNSDEWQHLDSFVPFCESLPIYIDDESSMSVQSFKTKSKKYVSEYGCKIIVVDYLQLMREKGSQNREQEVANISHAMKDVAKELNVPVIALAQLNRSVESRQGDKRPQLSDLRDSGSIEQDADIVCFIHRPEKYGIDLTEDGISTEGLGQIIIAKNRNGVVCDVNLHFTSELAKFEEWSDNVTTF